MTKKNIIFISVSLVLIILLGIGVSYSMWNITTSQDTNNTAYTECFDLTISNKSNNISLENAYPISNDKGIKLTPYTFTVTNTCDITAQYSVNLEVLKDSTLSSNFIDVMVDGNINLLSYYDKTDKVESSSIESRKVDMGILKAGESKEYSLRLWIDYDITMEDLNNETKIFKAKVNIVGKPISYIGDVVFNFDYTGGEQVFIVPVSGIYRLETWGAQGGNVNSNKFGGYGGYSNGNINLLENNILYINNGGQGKRITGLQSVIDGGYNGGGNAITSFNNKECISSSGGGATHISVKSGTLSLLENSKNSILIVSGAGGGYYYDPLVIQCGTKTVGNGGGYQGTNSQNYSCSFTNIVNSTGGSQTGGNAFGIGAGCKLGSECAGAGGGYYGGIITKFSGGGGSGYIGNTLLTNKIMYCYNCEESSEVSTKTVSTTCSEETPTSYCAKKGNGYARITLISIIE